MGAASAVTNFVSDAVSTVTNAVSDVGSFIDDNVIQPALNDPIGTIAKVAAVATGNPELVPLISGVDTVAQGGDLGQALTSAGTSYVGGQVGAGIGGDVMSNTGSQLAGQVAGGAASGATKALISGRDPLTGALTGGLGSGIVGGATELGAELGQDPNIGIANQSADPIATLNASQNWTGAMTDNIGSFAQELANQGYSESDIASKLMNNYGIDQYAAANAAGIASAGGTGSDISNVLAQDYGSNMTGIESDVAGPSTSLDNTGATIGKVAGTVLAPLAVSTLMGSGTTPTQTQSGYYPTSGSSSSLGSTASNVLGALPSGLKATSLAAAPVTQGDNMNLAQLKQLYPQLASVDPRILSMLTGKTGGSLGYADQSGGTSWMQGQASQPSPGYSKISANEKATPENAASFMGYDTSGGFNALTSAGLKSLGLTNFKKGGNVQGALHVPEFVTGKTGHYVDGKGDGQSDDIPAMLADGEYVFDADTVSALGNGSSKAGAQLLDHFREALREHKRSAPTDKIPPAASPLQYMKTALKRHKG